MASAKQLAHQRKVKAFYAKHGRFPRKGELSRATSKRSRPAKSAKATSSARSRAARKAARTRGKLSWKVKNWVKKHPVATTALAGGAVGGTALVVSPGARRTAAGAVARLRL
jgi:hypothetical protein